MVLDTGTEWSGDIPVFTDENIFAVVTVSAGGDFDFLCVLDYMEVGDDAPVFGEHKTGSLAILRHDAIEKIEGER